LPLLPAADNVNGSVGKLHPPTVICIDSDLLGHFLGQQKPKAKPAYKEPKVILGVVFYEKTLLAAMTVGSNEFIVGMNRRSRNRGRSVWKPRRRGQDVCQKYHSRLVNLILEVKT
jgi:hypothetical protein